MLPDRLRKSMTLTAPPAFDTGAADKCIVTLAQAKSHCRVDFIDDDDDIISAIKTATAELDGAEGALGRALLTQSWELRCDGFGVSQSAQFMVPGNTLASGVVGVSSARIKIPLPPLQTVDSIKYVDVNGVLQTLDPAVYKIVAGGIGHSWIAPAYGQYWPAHRLESDAIRIAFTSGYGKGMDVPAPIAHAAKIRIRDLYDNRNADVIEDNRATLLQLRTVESLLSRYVIDWI